MNIKNIQIAKSDLQVMLETGFILREAAKFQEAEAVFRGVMELMPESEVPNVGLGTVFLQRGDFAAAKEIYQAAINLNPESLYARLHYAEALLFSGEREKAEAALLEIIAIDADSPQSQTARALLEAADIISPPKNS
jgi:tetratricopeptide (TPR) repeat protein